ncbi:cytochrome c oxidase subunit 3 family protein [candidate division KSB1 bacterium]|nr:cytochrome c oxidase subunit 3 family protein [candidate division KSB1 bacterium]
MWAFLITEIMFFGGLFLGYIIYRTAYPAAFAEASRLLDYQLGAINTAVLICSSLTMVLAVRAAQMGQRRGLIVFLLLTILLGGVFLGNKVVEYSHKFHDHLVPGPNFGPEAPLAHPQQVELFFGFYFGMTGLHALHMIIGIVVLFILVVQAWRGRFSQDYFTPIDITGLYWHFVDIVWIFLFPLLYLISRT